MSLASTTHIMLILRCCLLGIALLLLDIQDSNAAKNTYSSKGRFEALPMVDPGKCAPAHTCDTNAKYRTIEGICSNPEHPYWGSSRYPFSRILPAKFSDGQERIRRSVNNKTLPLPRTVSFNVFPDQDVDSKRTTLTFVQWLQNIGHDVTRINDRRIANPLGKFRSQCCTADHKALPELPAGCMPLDLSKDPFYTQYNATCLYFGRGNLSDVGVCSQYPVQVANQLSSVLDASFVYGYNDTKANSLRAFENGKLKHFLLEDGREFCTQAETPEIPCLNPPTETRCYAAGDVRANLVTGMSLYHVLFVRMHNHFCDELLKINPSWNDEKLYQEARRIIGAVVQKITFKDFLPIYLGEEYTREKGLLTEDNLEDCINYFDPNINPTTLHEFGAAALRSAHSMPPREILLVNSTFQQESFILLDDFALQPYIIEKTGNFDKLLRGFAVQPHQRVDEFFSVALTRFWFKQSQNNVFGSDVESLDISRGRDVGLPTYNDIREVTGLGRAKTFKNFEDVITHESIQKLQKIYESPDDVDLFVGGMMEEHAPEAYSGPTFRNILGEQFYRYMRGDRFYFENCGYPSSFTKAQLAEIYKVSNAWILCKFSDNIDEIHSNVFYPPSESNPVVSCDNIPGLDLTAWKE